MIPKITDYESPKIIERKIDQNKLGSIGTDIGLIVLCVIAAFVSFWDVSVTLASGFSIGWVSIIIFFAATTVYRTKYDGGIYKGKQTKEYIEAMAKFSSYKELIMSKSLTNRLADWCNKHRITDLQRLRYSIVCPYMTYEEYEQKYKNLSRERIKQLDLSRQAKKSLRIANAIQPLELSADMLLNFSGKINLFGKRKALPTSGNEKREYDFAMSYISKFLVTFVCGMFLIEVLSDPTLERFLQWLVRMFPIVVAFLTGENNGYRNVVNVDTVRIDVQNQYLTLFFADEKIDTAN